MNCFISESLDIYYNLAMEEFLLKQTDKDFFFLWQSSPTLVLGKHQNPYKETDVVLADSKQIRIARRLSGGGTVFHDEGNINFTIIKTTEQGKQIDFKAHTHLIFQALRQMGIPVEYSPRKDLMLNGLKVSGNAEHVNKNRVLHHGTLLFKSDLNLLNRLLKPRASYYQDKTIASVPSKVGNLVPHYPSEQVELFIQDLFSEIMNNNSDFQVISMPKREEMELLRDTKYSTNEWIYAYTPTYRFQNQFTFKGREVEVSFQVKKSHISDFLVKGLSEQEAILLEQVFAKEPHQLEAFRKAASLLPKDWQTIYTELF